MDKGKQIVTGKSDAGVSGSTNKKIRALIDRSKLRILLCDTNAGSCKEVASLLKECSYQVISVGSTGEAIHVLSSEGPSIDIVLAELDLPMANCLKMLKYITEDQELRCIPVIMLVTEDKISMIANCLRYGAVDYLLTPLGINELLNLSIHMESKAHEKNDFERVLERPFCYQMMHPHPGELLDELMHFEIKSIAAVVEEIWVLLTPRVM